MSSDADAHKVGFNPRHPTVSGNIMGQAFFCYLQTWPPPAGLPIYGWLVTIIGALGLSWYTPKRRSRSNPVVLHAYARRCFGPFLGYQTNVLYWLACCIVISPWLVISAYLIFSYFFPILKDPLVLTITCVVVLWIFVLLNIVGPKMITRVQAVATVLGLISIVGIAVFGWF